MTRDSATRTRWGAGLAHLSRLGVREKCASMPGTCTQARWHGRHAATPLDVPMASLVSNWILTAP
eukprot:7509905-Lingulodinium_polyedra.AAC.1